MYLNIQDHMKMYQSGPEMGPNVISRLDRDWSIEGKGDDGGTRPPQFPLTQLPPTLRQMATRQTIFQNQQTHMRRCRMNRNKRCQNSFVCFSNEKVIFVFVGLQYDSIKPNHAKK